MGMDHLKIKTPSHGVFLTHSVSTWSTVCDFRLHHEVDENCALAT